MYLTDLAVACRKSGLRVVEEPGWKTRGHGGMTAVRSIACHHTAGGNDASDRRVVRDGRPGLSGPLAHILLETDGTVRVIAAGRCYHAGPTFVPTVQGNRYSIGIEPVNDGVGPWTVTQYQAYIRLVAALCLHYGLPTSRVYGHKEIASPKGRKPDPNFSMATFRREVEAARTGKLATVTVGGTATLVPTVAVPAKVVVDGKAGPQTIAAIQAMTGVPEAHVDGKWGPETLQHVQKWAGRPAGRTLTADDVRAVQAKVGMVPNGKWIITARSHDRTTAALQTFYNASKEPKSIVLPRGALLTKDGKADRATIAAFQHMWSAKEDGLWGPQTVRALQKWAGVKVDGIMGPITVKAVQTKTGAKVTGKWTLTARSYDPTTAALEEFYNNLLRTGALSPR